MKYFDLNIEKVLEHWSVAFAVREFVANALDEQILTGTKSIDIFKADGVWHIRDFGRGIKDVHFSQNENAEKMGASNLIGKFGVGLKDALAVCNRHNINVVIRSKYCTASTQMYQKSGFDIQTLHAVFSDSIDRSFVGTDISLFGLDDRIMNEAKSFFLCFSDMTKLESTRNGEVFLPKGLPKVYVNGLQIAVEEDFMFSYNITNATSALKKALNRERTNVGRSAYTEAVKSILTKCKQKSVLERLINDLQNFVMGTQKDESKWTDIARYAVKELDKSGEYVFVSAYKPLDTNESEIAKSLGKKIMTLPEIVLRGIEEEIYTFDSARQEYGSQFQMEEVSIDDLTNKEFEVFLQKEKLEHFLNLIQNCVKCQK